MKLITLNIWGGHIHAPLLRFIQTHQEVELFCLQEVYHNAKRKIADDERLVNLNILADLHALLPQHRVYFRPVVHGSYGIAMLVRKEIDVVGEGEIAIHENAHYPGSGPTHSRNLQWLECRIQQQPYTIMNVHGLWNGKGKSDCPERLSQSLKIKHFVENVKTPKIVCGDFNLRPETESLKIIEQGMCNLIKNYGIQTTRTSLYDKKDKEPFADYIFTSHEVAIKKFDVLQEEVSDHCALMLEIGKSGNC
jgi:endonuclease/exonuclease/phosphatase family metal-dependent hydrolase